MLLGPMFDRFVKQTPVCVAARAALEAALNAEAVDALFARTADRQYQRELLFSTCVDLMSLVVSRTHRSMHAAYQASATEIGVSVKAVYDKLSHVEPGTVAGLVRHTADRLGPVIRQMAGQAAPVLKNFRTRILDGNHLQRTERRLKPLRDVAAGPLPGQTLAVLDPELGLVIDLVCGEDGHAQERSLVGEILARVERGDLWIADRNFCTTNILFGIHASKARFIIRQHGSTLRIDGDPVDRRAGRSRAGSVTEHTLWLVDAAGKRLAVRRVTIRLDRPTVDGETEIHLLTNLTTREASAHKVAKIYRKRWTIEGVFQTLTTVLRCEVNTLGYPRAALFGFGVAVAAYNVFASVKAALRAVHGAKKVDEEVSEYFLADELAGTYRGMMVALPPAEWAEVGTASTQVVAALLRRLVQTADLSRYKKSTRGPKKPKPRRTRFAKAKHISTARLLAELKTAKKGQT